ncbi:hypothetical protein SNEBB_003093 [Seison nebaliae]|nr:hypothetical protein SNEBB_003093 [Seison nebaliae]
MSLSTSAVKQFYCRIRKVYKEWKTNSGSFENADALIFSRGSGATTKFYKSGTIQSWLFFFEISDCILALLPNEIIILAGNKKLQFFKSLISQCAPPSDIVPFRMELRNKLDHDEENFEKLLTSIKKIGSTNGIVGVFMKERLSGDFIDQWNQAMINDVNIKRVDISVGISSILSVKDSEEMNHMKIASQINNKVYVKFVRSYVTEKLVQKRNIQLLQMSKQIGKELEAPHNIPSNADAQHIDLSYLPVVQCGEDNSITFDHLIGHERQLQYNVISFSLGARYHFYCSVLIRTILIDPNEYVEKIYEIALGIHEHLVNSLRDGMELKELYKECEEKCMEEELSEYVPNNFGYVTGIEVKESNICINKTNSFKAIQGMTFVLAVQLMNIPNKEQSGNEPKNFSIQIADTVEVNDSTKAATFLTTAKRNISSIRISYKNKAKNTSLNSSGGSDYLNDSFERGNSNRDIGSSISGRLRNNGRVLAQKTRSEESAEARRAAHQKILLKNLNDEGKKRILNGKMGVAEIEAKKVKRRVAYNNEKLFPYNDAEVLKNRICVDRKFESIVLPVLGNYLPFHISVIKNASTSVQGKMTHLRINFEHPTSIKLEDYSSDEYGENGNLAFIKEFSFRSSNITTDRKTSYETPPSANLLNVAKAITEMKRKFKLREIQEKDQESVVKQAALSISSKPKAKLKDLQVRPNVLARRTVGTLEAHNNGFRFTSVTTSHEKIDILYSNIKHAFYQPCDKEIVILIHFHLKDAIMINKRKIKDIQFFTEVGELVSDLGRSIYRKENDDYEAEQRERELRHRLKSCFRGFCEQVEQIGSHTPEFEMPYRELGFNGTPFRSMVFLMPTKSCLVNITEFPACVITMSEIELVHFERISFGLNNFDMVFIFKNYHRRPQNITTIPMDQLDYIKNWIDKSDIKYTEAPQPMNWGKIMKTIVDDTLGFFENGGWNFLEINDSDVSRESDSEDDDEYAPTDDDTEYSTDSSEGSEASESEASTASSESGSVVSDGDSNDESESEEEERYVNKNKRPKMKNTLEVKKKRR